MKFGKGHSGNPNGRPRGSENVATGKVRALWQSLMLENMDQLREDIKQLEPKDRLNIALKISNFILPRLQHVEIGNYPDWAEMMELTAEERTSEMIRLKQQIQNDGQK